MRWLFLVLALACATAGTARADGPALATTTFTLDNGLKVIVHEDPSSPTVVVYLWYHVGSKDEVKGRSGFAHLFEHLMFKGSKHVADGEFDRLLEAAGGWNNGTTNTDRTTYFEQVPKNALELALYLEADRMAGLWDAMNQTVLDNQRDVVKNERRQGVDNQPYGRAEIRIQEAMWPEGHGNHSPTIGSMEDLTAASLKDVEHFYRNYYVPGNATLVLAGDVTAETARTLVQRYFGWMPKRPVPAHKTLTEPVTPLGRETRLADHDRVQLAKVSASWRSPTPFTKDDITLRVAAQVLAGSKSSRLRKRLMFDTTMASEVEAYEYPQLLGGEFRISALAADTVTPEALLAVFDEEMARLRAAPPTEDEVLRAKRALEAELLSSLESFYARADRIAEYDAYTGAPDFLGRELDMLRAVTPDEVHRVVTTWLAPDARVVMFVLPKADSDKNAETSGGAQ